MKRIAIATFVSNNYGTCLQAFALQEAVHDLGYQSTIVTNRNINRIKVNVGGKRIKYIKFLFNTYDWRDLIWPFNIINSHKYNQGRDRKFYDFIHNNLCLSQVDPVPCGFDAAITGSDMVWSTEYPKGLDFYFLDWIPQQYRIAYAPSIGSTVIPQHLVSKYQVGISAIPYLSCREQSAIDIIEEITGMHPQLVCDPTLLHDALFYREHTPKISKPRPYWLINCFGGIDYATRCKIEKQAKRLRKDVRYINAGIHESSHEYIYDKSGYGPLEFLSLSCDSEFQIVNGYHGLIFALIFQKPFVCFHRPKREHWAKHESRMKDLLDYLNLSDRYIEVGPINERFLSLDYTIVNKRLEILRKKSWDFLEQSLKQATS